MASLLTGLLDLLAPPRCLACRRRSPPPWCVDCAAVVRELPSGCRWCAAPPGRGHACWPGGAPIDGMVAAFDYSGPVASAVATAKLGGATAGWRPLAAALALRVAERDPDIDVVTWVTTPPARVRRRGLDHARVLAAGVAHRLGQPLLQLLFADDRGGPPDRYRSRIALPGTNVLLVDDVVTTGATVVRAAGELRAAGAGGILVAAVARAGNHPLSGPLPGTDRPAGTNRPVSS